MYRDHFEKLSEYDMSKSQSIRKRKSTMEQINVKQNKLDEFKQTKISDTFGQQTQATIDSALQDFLIESMIPIRIFNLPTFKKLVKGYITLINLY